MLDIDQDIMDLSTKLLNQYTLSHGMTIYDAKASLPYNSSIIFVSSRK